MSSAQADDHFDPPTPKALGAYLDAHRPRPPSSWTTWGPLAAAGTVIVGGLAAGGQAAMLLPWVALGGLLGYLSFRVHRARSLERSVARAQEAAMLERFGEAFDQAWRLVPRATGRPMLHVRLVTLMGHCLEHAKAYETALGAYDRLLPHLPEEHPGTLQLRVHYALAALGAEHLADADEALRRLRGAIQPGARTMLAAAYRLAKLLQSVRTHHYADGLEGADHLLEDLRPLGIDAGYGHALLALCYREVRGDERQAEQRRQATRLWWNRATLLVDEQKLVDRFPELRVMRETGT